MKNAKQSKEVKEITESLTNPRSFNQRLKTALSRQDFYIQQQLSLRIVSDINESVGLDLHGRYSRLGRTQ